MESGCQQRRTQRHHSEPQWRQRPLGRGPPRCHGVPLRGRNYAKRRQPVSRGQIQARRGKSPSGGDRRPADLDRERPLWWNDPARRSDPSGYGAGPGRHWPCQGRAGQWPGSGCPGHGRQLLPPGAHRPRNQCLRGRSKRCRPRHNNKQPHGRGDSTARQDSGFRTPERREREHIRAVRPDLLAGRQQRALRGLRRQEHRPVRRAGADPGRSDEHQRPDGAAARRNQKDAGRNSLLRHVVAGDRRKATAGRFERLADDQLLRSQPSTVHL